MDTMLLVFLAAFAIGAGTFIGAGNHSGLAGAILPGIIVGLLLGAPFIRSHLWYSSALVVVCAIVGSIAINYVSDSNGLKCFYRNQSNLVVSFGSYKLGQKSGE